MSLEGNVALKPEVNKVSKIAGGMQEKRFWKLFSCQ